ncbi:IS1 family transposase [Anaerolinea thermolimosa]
MLECPKCHRTERQNRGGKTESGSQRYRCLFC